MALILCLESTTTNCSVSLAKNGQTIALKEDRSAQYSHAEKLHLFINEVLQETASTLADIEAVAVSKGPGSYTGLRIGVSAAKGLCFSLGVPLLSVSTLRVLAKQVVDKNQINCDFIIPLLDARRMEVYTAVFDASLQEIEPIAAKIVEENSYADYLGEGNKVVFIGNGVDKFEAICASSQAFFENNLPSAREMASLAEEKFQQNQTEDVAYFEPYYLKDFIVTQKKKKAT